MEAIVLAAVIISALIGLLFWIERAERRRRRAWHHAYFHQGGLVRELMRRWRPTPKLTDQRSKSDPGQAQ